MTNKKYTTVEAARGIAASLVVFYHVSRHYMYNTGEMPFGSLFLFGHAGVDFFFVLSGFIIYLIHHQDIGTPGKANRFLFRRVIRIYPIFWAAFCVACLFSLIGQGHLPPLNIQLIKDILLLPGDSIVGVSWSLRHEILFYGFFLILICNQLVGTVLAIAWLSLMVLSSSEQIPDILTSKYNLQFFMGMLVAYLISNNNVKNCIDAQKATVILILGSLLFIGFPFRPFYCCCSRRSLFYF